MAAENLKQLPPKGESKVEQIQKRLNEIEKQHGIKIIYAAEAGSRATGLSQPDSDYDVRFIYVRPLSHYLRLNSLNDTMNPPIKDGMDYEGWDIHKVLGRFRGGFTQVMEWLASPVRYRNDGGALLRLATEHFSATSACHNYVNTAANLYRKSIRNLDKVKPKAYLQVIRALYMAEFVRVNRKMPPMDFTVLEGPEELEAVIGLLISLPRKEPADAFPELHQWIEKDIERLRKAANGLPGHTANLDQLNEIFFNYVMGQ